MPSESELIAKFDSIRSILHELFYYGYRESAEIYGEEGHLPIGSSDFYEQIRHLKNFIGDYLINGTNKRKTLQSLSIGAARMVENPIYRLLKAHSITYTRLSLHFALLAALEELWRDPLYAKARYRLGDDDLQVLKEGNRTKRELYDHICRQLNRDPSKAWLIQSAAVDGKTLKEGQEKQKLLQKLTDRQYNELFRQAVRNAQANASAQIALDDGWHLVATGDFVWCYRLINQQLESMNEAQLKAYWQSRERTLTYDQLISSAIARSENRRTGPLRFSKLRADDIIQINPQRILLYIKNATAPFKLLSYDFLRQHFPWSDCEKLRDLLAGIWADYCSGQASMTLGGHTYTLNVCWSETADAPFTMRVFENRLPAYVGNGLILCQTDQKPYRYRPSPLRPRLYGQGLFELYPALRDAVVFFSEISPLGALGSQIMDQVDLKDRPYVFRDRYFGQVADSLLLFDLLESIRRHQLLEVTTELRSEQMNQDSLFQPMCVLSDLHQGRQYLYGYNLTKSRYESFRMDMIRTAKPSDQAEWSEERTEEGLQLLQKTWSSRVRTERPFSLSMELSYDPSTEAYIHERVCRESRNANVDDSRGSPLLVSTEIWDPKEMMPWTLSMMGRIAHLRSSVRFQERFREHVETMHQRYNGLPGAEPIPFAKADRHFKPAKLPPDKTHTASPLFLDFASRYVICCQHILSSFSSGRIKTADAEQKIQSIAREYGFSRTATPELKGKKPFEGLTLTTLLDNRMLRRENIGDTEHIASSVNHTQDRPFTFWELRWLLTILQDRRMQLFLTGDEIREASGLIRNFLSECSASLHSYDPTADIDEPADEKSRKKDVQEEEAPQLLLSSVVSEPLYTAQTYREQGVCHDSDSYSNEDYQYHFGILTNCICSGKPALVTYRPTKHTDSRTTPLWPLKLEYSPMRDKFYLIARTADGRYYTTIRLSTITGVEYFRGEADPANRGTWEDYLEKSTTSDEEALDVIVSSESNAIERFLLEFSVYRKQTQRIGNSENFRVKVWYLKSDTNEMIVKLLRFGRTIEVLGPEPVRSEIARQVEKQYGLLETALPPAPPSTPPAVPEA